MSEQHLVRVPFLEETYTAMPITIVGPNNQATMPIGPGSFLQASSDFVGPFPTGTSWDINVTSDLEGAHILLSGNVNSTSHVVDFQLGVPQTDVGWTWTGDAGILDGSTAYIQALVIEPGTGTIDSGTQAMPYSVGAAGEAWQVAQPASGGLTPTEAQQLTETTDSSALVKLYNFLSHELLTPVPTGQPIVQQLLTPVYGCIVRLTTIPDGLAPQTPDQQYWVQTLAVVRVFSGNDLWVRAPIHTPTKITSFWGEHLLIGLPAVVVQQWLENLRLLVDFLPGVEGTVILLHLPA